MKEMSAELIEFRERKSKKHYPLVNAESWRRAFELGFDYCHEYMIARQEVLESQASQFDSTLKETMKTRDELNEKLKIAVEALGNIANECNVESDCYSSHILKVVNNRIKAREALQAIAKEIENETNQTNS